MALYATADATSPSPGFGFTCWKAPQSTRGFLAITVKQATPAIPLVGVNIWVDPNPILILTTVVTDTKGIFNMKIPLMTGLPKGLKVYAQCIWANTASCGGVGTNSASNGLEITIQ